MYRLGYELCEDGVREVFRVAAGSPDSVTWPCPISRCTWLRGLGFMRHICDTALELLIENDLSQGTLRRRPYSGSSAWTKSYNCPLMERTGDYSVLYAMHYFNHISVDEGVAVKAHVDPSLLVLEPFLCQDTTGLQVWDRSRQKWLDCDGPTSPVAELWHDYEVVLLFVGKALGTKTSMEPTLHRVVTGNRPRRTVIYEQKYEELFPPPVLD
jgi:hypothetical protein